MFEYLAEKVSKSSFSTDPFKHIYLEDFFSDEHFEAIVSQPEILIEEAESDQLLIEKLHQAGYAVISFPGTTGDLNAYMDWHVKKTSNVSLNGAMTVKELCEGVGVTFRLQSARSEVIRSLMDFLQSKVWLDAIADKFSVDISEVRSDGGIQKYLDGYEISPHPDVRGKALTYMVNINPTENSEDNNYHTHYMRFCQEKSYVQEFWKGNQDLDRCWVPWNWCETVKLQKENNTIVIFQPNDDTLHAVRANYEHLKTQRTQLYGNLWYNEKKAAGLPKWTDFDLRSRI